MTDQSIQLQSQFEAKSWTTKQLPLQLYIKILNRGLSSIVPYGENLCMRKKKNEIKQNKTLLMKRFHGYIVITVDPKFLQTL